MQHKRQRAEHDDDDAGDERHHRDVPRHHIGSNHGGDDRHHERAGRDKQMEFGVGDKEHDQRTEFGRELEQRVRLGLVHHSVHQARLPPSFETALRASSG